MIFGKRQIVDTSPAKIGDLLTRGVEEIFVKDHLEKNLKSGKTLRVKLGFDPTGANIHIGRATVLRKLRAFQDLGHTAVFVVGDFTARIGDPSDKLEKRPMLTKEIIEKNLKNYKEQVGKIINLKKAEFHFNSSWLRKLNFEEIAELAESFTVQQMSNRRNFEERLSRNIEISVREFLYPLMQGYDSVAIKADVELGGFDQLFNLKAGRVIQRHYGLPEQDVLTTQMLEGTDGRKMSTSWGNVINITDAPNDMYGKVMSVNDTLIEKYYILATDLSPESGTDPKQSKMRLAKEIVKLYHGAQEAEKAENYFVRAFSQKEVPEEIETIDAEKNQLIADVIVQKGIVSSKTDWKRLVGEGAVTDLTTNQALSDQFVKVERDITLKIGKRRFVKIKIK